MSRKTLFLSDVLRSLADEIGGVEVSSVNAEQITRRIKATALLVTRSKPCPNAKDLPPLAAMRARYAYNSDTGVVSRRMAGGGLKPMGEAHATGYVRLNISHGGTRFRCAAHRLAWLLHYGIAPPLEAVIDHIDGDRANNAIRNLRLATPKENSAFYSERTGIVPVPPQPKRKKAPAA